MSTNIQKEGDTIVVSQSWPFGILSADAMVMQQSNGVWRISPEVRGAKLNGKELEVWKNYPIQLGNIVGLPHGGTFTITKEVLAGGKPVVVP